MFPESYNMIVTSWKGNLKSYNLKKVHVNQNRIASMEEKRLYVEGD